MMRGIAQVAGVYQIEFAKKLTYQSDTLYLDNYSPIVLDAMICSLLKIWTESDSAKRDYVTFSCYGCATVFVAIIVLVVSGQKEN